MQAAIGIALPFFAVILCGYLAGHFRVMPEGGIAGVNAFVFWFALPAMLFITMASTPFERLLDREFLLAYVSATMAVFLAALALARVLFHAKGGELALHGLSAIFNNTGYMGLPLIGAALGAGAAAPVILTLTVDNTLMMALAVAMLERRRGHDDSRGAAVATLAALVRNPLIVAIAFGTLASALRMPIPGPLDSFLRLIGGAAGPCALFALGASLTARAVTDDAAQIAQMAGFKLFIHPAAVWFAMTSLGVDPLWTIAATLSAAMPIGGTAFVLAERYKTAIARVSAAVLISTALSVVTVSALIALLRP